ncbi:MAG: hypothetical protein U0Q16_05275 [Bryobacteraceae bacterium]
MPQNPTPLPANPSLESLRKRAKERVRQLRASGDAAATLADAQHEIAREHGFATWAALKHHIEALRPPGIEPFERLANDLAAAYTSGDERTVRAINANNGTAFPTDFHEAERVRQRMPTWYASESRAPELAVADARQMVAHAYGFENWAQFAASLTQAPADPRSSPVFLSSRPPFYGIDWQEGRLSARGPQTMRDWEEIFAVVEEYGISKLAAGGIPDEAMKGLSQLECVTHLNVSGSKALTDAGTRHLARMPQLTDLEIGGWHTALTARAFEPLRHLAQLRRFQCCWTQGFTDEAAACLAACDRIETVNAMGTPAGDGLIRALAGKADLRYLDTGHGVTDAGIPALHRIPAFARWLGGEVRTGLMGAAHVPTRVLIDGEFTDAGIAALAGLDGVASLSFFWHSKAFTPAGLEPLRRLPNLEVFGIDGDQCPDEAMRQIAAIPRLRQLQAQGAVAGDAGWQALGRSQTLEYVWGRECPNFTSRGFLALTDAPSLRGIGISCKQVEDSALEALPRFPQLRQFVSIDVPDAGFRHVGRCENLESLYCMYCRNTGDVATEHIRGLAKLRNYYAGMTLITDRSLEILSRIVALEKLEFWQCVSITDAGVAQLAALPGLKELEIHSSPRVSPQVARLFRNGVRVVCSG